jgi:hypothetical protein
MRVQDLKDAIESFKDVLVVSGNKKQVSAVTAITEALTEHADKDVDMFLDELGKSLDSQASAAPHYIQRLVAAGLDESLFKAAWQELDSDRALNKETLQNICKGYTGSFDKRAGLTTLKNDIKRAFEARLYDRDAQAMANSATPW